MIRSPFPAYWVVSRGETREDVRRIVGSHLGRGGEEPPPRPVPSPDSSLVAGWERREKGGSGEAGHSRACNTFLFKYVKEDLL